MRAGEHDDVGPPPLDLDEARRDLIGDRGAVDRLAAHPRLGERGEIRRADEAHMAILAKLRMRSRV